MFVVLRSQGGNTISAISNNPEFNQRDKKINPKAGDHLKKPLLVFITIVILLFSSGVVLANNPPSTIPPQYWGTVTYNGTPVANGSVEAVIDGTLYGSHAIQEGTYGSAPPGSNLYVSGEGLTGKTIYFRIVSGNISVMADQTAVWAPEAAVELNLTYTGNTDATLSDLQVNGATITGFASSQLTYKVGLTSGTTIVPTVTARTTDSKARAEITQAAGLPGSAIVLVTAEDGITQKTYTINLTVLQPVAVTTEATSVPVNNTPLQVIVPSDVNNAVLTTNPVDGVVTVPQVNVQAATSLGNVNVIIPDGTRVSGPAGWEGTINLPQVRDNSSVTIPPEGETPATVSAVIEIGLADTTLTFNKPVRILLAGQGGKKAGWIQNDNFTPITWQMSADSAAALGNNNDGYLTVGNDLVIWTRHFTTFVAYSQQSQDECFIATAAFGSKFDWPVALLRAFRDQYLLTNPWGQAFVSFYYQNSPPIAAFIAASEPLRALVRALLAPIIAVVYLLYHPGAMAIFLIIAAITGYILRIRRKIRTA